MRTRSARLSKGRSAILATLGLLAAPLLAGEAAAAEPMCHNLQLQLPAAASCRQQTRAYRRVLDEALQEARAGSIGAARCADAAEAAAGRIGTVSMCVTILEIAIPVMIHALLEKGVPHGAEFTIETPWGRTLIPVRPPFEHALAQSAAEPTG